jgi:hypothetical protein
MADTKNTVRLANTTAHVKHISLGGGASIAVPPVEGGGVDLAFETDAERESFARALDTATVKKWIESGELVVVGGAVRKPTPTPSDAPPPPPTPSAAPPAERHATEAAQVTARKTNRE